MEISKENITYDRIIRKRFSVSVNGKETVGEKLLTVTARAYTGRCEVLSGEVIAEGYVVFTALYSDEEGNIRKKEHTERFAESEKCDGAEPSTGIYSVCNVSKVKAYTEAGTVMFSATVTISSILFTKENRELIKAEGDLKKKEDTFIANECTLAQQLRFSLTEKRELSPRLPEAEEILTVSFCPKITDVRISAGQLIIGGEAQVQTVYRSDDEYEPIVQITDRIEFSRITDINGSGETAEVFLTAESSVAEIENDENGEKRSIKYAFDLCGYAYSVKKTEYTYLSDAYSVTNRTEVTKERFNVSLQESEERFNATGSLSVRLPENKPPVSRISAVYFSPDLSESNQNGSKNVLSGTADISVVYQSSGSGETEGFNVTVPVKIDVDCTGIPFCCEVTDMQAVLVSGGETEIRYTVTGKLYEINSFAAEAVTDICDKGEREADEFGIVIYTVCKNESMWDICKKFGVDEKGIRAVNEDMKNEPEAGDKIYIFKPIAV